jgi:hypothetical protein
MTFSRRLQALLHGDPTVIVDWLDERSPRWMLACLAVIVFGCGIYGSTIGLWHAPLQAVYTAVKLPLVILLTAGGNALLNGVLAQLLGTGMSFRQTSRAILMSFTIASLILASLSPLVLFVLVNTPAMHAGGQGEVMLLTLVACIAFAGLVANVRLLLLIKHLSPGRSAALRTLFAWLAGNLLLGSQIAWILRPYIGPPTLPVEFLRSDPWHGNFFEAVGSAVLRLLNS